ncbi:hypothetical protein CP02DC18_1245B, partial [Chlamydia psittaci 02DC18]
KEDQLEMNDDKIINFSKKSYLPYLFLLFL